MSGVSSSHAQDSQRQRWPQGITATSTDWPPQRAQRWAREPSVWQAASRVAKEQERSTVLAVFARRTCWSSASAAPCSTRFLCLPLALCGLRHSGSAASRAFCGETSTISNSPSVAGSLQSGQLSSPRFVDRAAHSRHQQRCPQGKEAKVRGSSRQMTQRSTGSAASASVWQAPLRTATSSRSSGGFAGGADAAAAAGSSFRSRPSSSCSEHLRRCGRRRSSAARLPKLSTGPWPLGPVGGMDMGRGRKTPAQ
mmetsp:Transcript_7605/g.21403  ORF Transcript_7605/g.21403 Transcript_7605/m.21403 type:complete len:253 (+) Transcript_7605:308-1066(+)